MILNLDKKVLDNHKQKYPNSCVPMAIELVLKLMGKVNLDYYELQDEKGNVSRCGENFNKRIINETLIKIEFDYLRDYNFPLIQLFEFIENEINKGRFVNCAWKQPFSTSFHAYVIYGFENEEFLAVSTDFGSELEYINDMKTRLKNINGSDILTFTDIKKKLNYV